jgi:hypothetical protein
MFRPRFGLAHRLAHQQRAAGAVAGRVHHDQRAARAVVGVGGQRQRLLQFEHHFGDLVDGQGVGFGGLQGVDVQPVVDLHQARLHPAVAVAQPVLAARRGGFGVQPGQGGAEAARGCKVPGVASQSPRDTSSWRSSTTPADWPACAAAVPCPARRKRGDRGLFAAGKELHRVAHLHAALGDAAPQHAGLFAHAFAGACHVLHGQAEGRLGLLLCRGQSFEQLQQAGALVPGCAQRRGDVVATQRRHRHDAGHADARLLRKGAQARLTAA